MCEQKYKDEPTFTLVGRDKLAARVVRAWIDHAMRHGVNEAKVKDAIGDAEAFERFVEEHPELMKLPD